MLFVCVHNAGRSRMAAALLHHRPYVDLDLAYPAGRTVAEIRPIGDEIDRRVTALPAELTAAGQPYDLAQ